MYFKDPALSLDDEEEEVQDLFDAGANFGLGGQVGLTIALKVG